MKLLNCRLDEANRIFGNRRIVFFGQGSWLKSIDYTELMELQENFLYVVDNNPSGEVKLDNQILKSYSPEKLRSEREIVIILTSPIYMYDMYNQLVNMGLDESIDCYAFPFMQKITNRESDYSIDYKGGEQKIPKIIHSFWFSGEEKPESYQKCIDTWPRFLGDYEIKEWTLDNYDWHKNRFLEKAIECRAWAYACDYARLDVLNNYGGIYLDMDVEVLKTFDDLLGNEAILSFSNNTLIDLAVVGASKGNILMKQLLDIYEEINPPKERKDFSKFFQPSLIRSVLASDGIEMNGCLQRTQNATVFPHEFFMPLDYVLFDEGSRNENTYCVHYDNFGWSYDKVDKRAKKIRDNELLWEML